MGECWNSSGAPCICDIAHLAHSGQLTLRLPDHFIILKQAVTEANQRWSGLGISFANGGNRESVLWLWFHSAAWSAVWLHGSRRKMNWSTSYHRVVVKWVPCSLLDLLLSSKQCRCTMSKSNVTLMQHSLHPSLAFRSHNYAYCLLNLKTTPTWAKHHGEYGDITLCLFDWRRCHRDPAPVNHSTFRENTHSWDK